VVPYNTTQHNIPKDGILPSHRRESLKYYVLNDGFDIDCFKISVLFASAKSLSGRAVA
jgi:hypothetical protein